MAKLMLIVSVASLLMFAHVVIVCAKPPSSASNLVAKLFSSERKPPRDRTDDDWKKQVDDSYNELRTSRIRSDWIRNAEDWLSNFKRISSETDCTEQLQSNLLDWRITGKKLRSFHALINDYLELYLDVCGYEERFKKAIENLKPIAQRHGALAKNPSLYLDLKKLGPRANIGGLLSAIKALSELGSISKEIDCSKEHETGLLRWVNDSMDLESWSKLVDDYFALYLSKCGYEGYFKKAIENLKPIAQRHRVLAKDPNLCSYLKKLGPWTGIAGVLSAIKGLSELVSIDDDIDCSEVHLTNLLRWLDASRSSGSWHEFLNDYFALILNRCGLESVYEKAISRALPGSFKSPTLYKHVTDELWYRQDKERLLLAMKDILEMESLSEVTGCSGELKTFLFYSASERPSNRQFREPLMDEYFPIYSEKCGFEARFKKVVANIQQTPNHSWTPTAYPTLLSCLKGKKFIEDMSWIPSAIEELSEFNLQSKETYCTDEVLGKLLDWQVKSQTLKGLSIIMRDNFALYLDKCGLEQSFEERIGNLDQESDIRQDPVKRLTLLRYLGSKDWDRPRLIWVLSIIRKLSESVSIFKDTDCTEKLEDDMIEWLVTDGDYQGMLPKQYLGPYLDKCGFEALFEKVSKTIVKKPNKQSDPVAYPTLFSYMRTEKFSRHWAPKWILSVVRELSGWESNPNEAYCTDQRIANWVRWLQDSAFFREFSKLINDYFGLYLDKCGFDESYKRTIGNIDEHSDQYLNLANCPTLYSYLGLKKRQPEDLTALLSVIQKLSESNSIFKEADCTGKLQTDMAKWLVTDENYQGLLPKQYLALYLDKCGFEAQFKQVSKNIEKKPNKLFDSGTYPTLYSLIRRAEFKEDWVLGWMLSAIKELSGWESISKETYCTGDRMSIWVDWLSKCTSAGTISVLIHDYFELYLDECGFEDSFKVVIKTIEQETGQGWDWENRPTLYSQLVSDPFSNKFYLRLVLSDFKKLSELESISRDTDSAKELMEDLIRRSSGKLQMFVSNYLETNPESI